MKVPGLFIIRQLVCASSYQDDYDWQPPTDAEMKVIQARRERSDKISNLMGECLLKGYKMLSSICDICETILLETPGGEKYCIACRELDEDAEKDNPVFQSQTQSSQQEKERRERSDTISKLLGDYLLKGYKMLGSTCEKCETILLQDRSRKEYCVVCEEIDVEKFADQAMADPVPVNPSTRTALNTAPSVKKAQPLIRMQSCDTFTKTFDVLKQKIFWATEQLQEVPTVEYNIQMCNLIKSAADAISSLQTIELN